MKAVIEIEMDNAAFEDSPASELARILRGIAAKVANGETEIVARDINGNSVGSLEITTEEE